MTIKKFLIGLKKAITDFKKDRIIGKSGFSYSGVNKTDRFGSPGGGSWDPSIYPAFEFTNDDEIYLIRIIPEFNKIVIESIKQQSMILNYSIKDNSFIDSGSESIEIKDNYKMTVRHSIDRETVKKALSKVGMKSDTIYKGSPTDWDNIIASLISWAGKRAAAKNEIRAQKIDAVNKGENYSEEYIDDLIVKHPLNTILYGPPGTGKTFHSITHALSIIDGEDIDDLISNCNTNEGRSIVKNSYHELLRSGRIYFTTFHQNLSYEDFIEGIKPQEPTDDDDFLKYEIQDGLFMRACVEATFSYLSGLDHLNRSEIKEYVDYNYLFDKLFEKISDAGTLELETRAKGNKVTATPTIQGNIAIKHTGKEKAYTVSRDRLMVLYERFPNPGAIGNITSEFRNAIGGCNSTAYWSVLNAIVKLKDDLSKTSRPIGYDPANALNYDQKKAIVKKFWLSRDIIANKENSAQPFVFIIDEINRGNVAQIFGELITLIEEDKRLGKSEVIYVDLPYSKKPFAVPPNLYIIGTMNTADRSVEALDTALRRRFSFKHVPSNPSLLDTTVDGVNLELLLSRINERLTILKDNDHTIGHAWLMDNSSVKDLQWLQKIFGDKILPLLREYFYGDYEKIGLVLGEAFFEEITSVDPRVFARFKKGTNQASQYNQSWQFKLKAVEDLTVSDFKALYETSSNTMSALDEDE